MTSLKSVNDFKAELRGVSLKATSVRVAMLRFLESTNKPIDVNSIIEYLQKNDVDADPATVFRSINLFTQRGLLKQFQFKEGKQRYELASRPDHHHLICENCGSIEDISDCNIGNLEKEIETKKGFLVKYHALEFFGLCKNCQTR